MDDLDAEYFSRWYAEMGEVPDKDALWTRLLGLPSHVLSTSVLPGSGLDEVAGILALGADDVLLDFACGRAGYGLELIARSGARLVGVDFAAAAIDRARANAAHLGLAERAELRVADMDATGLASQSVTALLCLDAANFPDDPAAVFAEAHRGNSPCRFPRQLHRLSSCPRDRVGVILKWLSTGISFFGPNYDLFEDLEAEANSSIEMREFIPIEKVDPIYFE